mmetsp:Transcript_143175/g.399035  ORF Transcript_143175/g.399035 Transcript_143175/m.399035 type:complete len:207 (-) Transcript_143175:229-849(-)
MAVWRLAVLPAAASPRGTGALSQRAALAAPLPTPDRCLAPAPHSMWLEAVAASGGPVVPCTAASLSCCWICQLLLEHVRASQPQERVQWQACCLGLPLPQLGLQAYQLQLLLPRLPSLPAAASAVVLDGAVLLRRRTGALPEAVQRTLLQPPLCPPGPRPPQPARPRAPPALRTRAQRLPRHARRPPPRAPQRAAACLRTIALGLG